MNRLLLRTAILLIPALTLAGCEGDFVHDPTRPRVNRATGPNVENNSALGEMNNSATTGTPILSVDLPNKKDESPKVHTIVDAVNKPPARPATAPPSIPPGQPAPSIIQQPGADPVNGPRQ